MSANKKERYFHRASFGSLSQIIKHHFSDFSILAGIINCSNFLFITSFLFCELWNEILFFTYVHQSYQTNKVLLQILLYLVVLIFPLLVLDIQHSYVVSHRFLRLIIFHSFLWEGQSFICQNQRKDIRLQNRYIPWFGECFRWRWSEDCFCRFLFSWTI